MDVAILIDGVETSLSDGVICWLDAWEGVGLNTITRLASQGPQQRGDSDRGFRVQPRFVTLVLKVTGTDEADLDARKAQLFQLVKPDGIARTLVFTKAGVGDESSVDIDPVEDISADDGLRYIDVQYWSHEVSGRFARRHEKVGVIFKASDPDFYGPSGVATFGQSGGSGGFSVPMPVPHGVGSSTLSETKNVTYAGTAPVFPSVRISGPIDDAVFENLTTGEVIDFTGINIADGDWVEIDLRYGFKRVLDQDDVYVQVSEDSDLATFHLAPDPEAAGGVNVLKISGDNVNTNTRVDVSWITRYAFL